MSHLFLYYCSIRLLFTCFQRLSKHPKSGIPMLRSANLITILNVIVQIFQGKDFYIYLSPHGIRAPGKRSTSEYSTF